VLGRRRALLGVAGSAVAVLIAGCAAAASSTVTVSGSTLTVYSSLPPAGAGGQQAQDVYLAEQLALKENGAQIGTFTVRLVALNGKKLSDNARTAIQKTNTIAYLGEVLPGSSAQSLGITNDQGVLQVSPTDTAIELTQATPAISGAPDRYYEALKTYGRTFARVVPTAAIEAKAQVQEMKALGVTKLYVADDGSEYGTAVAFAVRGAAAPGISIVQSPTGADAVFFGGTDVAAAARVFNGAGTAKLFGPSALDPQALLARLSLAAQQNLYLSSPGFPARSVTPAGQAFVTAFTTAFGHAPATQAIFGYEAMKAVLAVLKEAGSAANNRATVVHDFFAIKNRDSALGTYTIDSTTGDTSLASFVFSHVRNGKLVPLPG
jgi:branched-chain amino acid transport system substrate-binding protein